MSRTFYARRESGARVCFDSLLQTD